jgi:hypothetical protein
LKYFYLIYPLLYLTTLIVGVSKYSKIKNSLNLKLFLIFIGYSFLTEISAVILGVFLGINTFPIYNTWILVNQFFFFFFFINLLQNSFKKYIVKFIIGLYALFTLIAISFYINFSGSYLSMNDIIGSILIVIVILMYFSELLQSDKILNINKSIYFWISLGVLLFNIGFIPVNIFAEFISFNGVFNIVAIFLNVLMAGCFITGFIVSKKEFDI